MERSGLQALTINALIRSGWSLDFIRENSGRAHDRKHIVLDSTMSLDFAHRCYYPSDKEKPDELPAFHAKPARYRPQNMQHVAVNGGVTVHIDARSSWIQDLVCAMRRVASKLVIIGSQTSSTARRASKPSKEAQFIPSVDMCFDEITVLQPWSG